MRPTRLPCPWDSPSKNTEVGCHFLLQCMKVKSESEVAQLCPTLSDLMDWSLPGSSIHGIFQARVLEWGCHCLSLPDAHINKMPKYFAASSARLGTQSLLEYLTLSCGTLLSFFNFILFLNFTILDWFCHISKWIRHRFVHFIYILKEPAFGFVDFCYGLFCFFCIYFFPNF